MGTIRKQINSNGTQGSFLGDTVKKLLDYNFFQKKLIIYWILSAHFGILVVFLSSTKVCQSFSFHRNIKTSIKVFLLQTIILRVFRRSKASLDNIPPIRIQKSPLTINFLSGNSPPRISTVLCIAKSREPSNCRTNKLSSVSAQFKVNETSKNIFVAFHFRGDRSRSRPTGSWWHL
jgi:hypothetical protein